MRTLVKEQSGHDTGHDINERITLQVAAKALNVSTKTIQRWIKDGKFSSTKEGKRVYVPIDEVRLKLQGNQDKIEDTVLDKNNPVQTKVEEGHNTGHNEDKSINIIPIERAHYEGLLTRLGQLENERQYLLEYKEGLQAKDRELAEAKSALATNTDELEKAKSTIAKARSELQKLLEVKQDAEAKGKVLVDQQSKIEQLEAEVERLKKPWWKRIFLK